jgi:hypothetical protein
MPTPARRSEIQYLPFCLCGPRCGGRCSGSGVATEDAGSKTSPTSAAKHTSHSSISCLIIIWVLVALWNRFTGVDCFLAIVIEDNLRGAHETHSESCYSNPCTEMYRVSFIPKYNIICEPDLIKYQQIFPLGIGYLTTFRQMLPRLPSRRTKGSRILPPTNVSHIIESRNARYTCLQLLVRNMIYK